MRVGRGKVFELMENIVKKHQLENQEAYQISSRISTKKGTL